MMLLMPLYRVGYRNKNGWYLCPKLTLVDGNDADRFLIFLESHPSSSWLRVSEGDESMSLDEECVM